MRFDKANNCWITAESVYDQVIYDGGQSWYDVTNNSHGGSEIAIGLGYRTLHVYSIFLYVHLGRVILDQHP